MKNRIYFILLLAFLAFAIWWIASHHNIGNFLYTSKSLDNLEQRVDSLEKRVYTLEKLIKTEYYGKNQH